MVQRYECGKQPHAERNLAKYFKYQQREKEFQSPCSTVSSGTTSLSTSSSYTPSLTLGGSSSFKTSNSSG